MYAMGHLKFGRLFVVHVCMHSSITFSTRRKAADLLNKTAAKITMLFLEFIHLLAIIISFLKIFFPWNRRSALLLLSMRVLKNSGITLTKKTEMSSMGFRFKRLKNLSQWLRSHFWHIFVFWYKNWELFWRGYQLPIRSSRWSPTIGLFEEFRFFLHLRSPVFVLNLRIFKAFGLLSGENLTPLDFLCT